MERCDLIDVLEESVVTRAPVHVELDDGTTFEDVVRDVRTEGGQDFADLRAHGTVPVRTIRAARRA